MSVCVCVCVIALQYFKYSQRISSVFMRLDVITVRHQPSQVEVKPTQTEPADCCAWMCVAINTNPVSNMGGKTGSFCNPRLLFFPCMF